MQKTHTTAVVLIPPAPLWEPIQAIRAVSDRGYHRWMPHITLLYPFVSRAAWQDVVPAVAQACRSIPPFALTLGTVAAFRRGNRPATIYLSPTPTAPLLALHHSLLAAVPICDDTSRHSGGYTPHLTIGQSPPNHVDQHMRAIAATWQPLVWSVTSVALIWRHDPPDDVFRVGETFSLAEEA